MRRLFVLICFFCFSSSALATSLVLTPPTGSALGFGAGGTRGDIITMTGDLSISSIGIDALILAGQQETFNAYVYSAVGGNGVTPLAVGPTQTFTGTGTEQFYDLPVSFDLLAGQSYDIGISFNSFNDPNLEINFYFFDSSSNPPFSVGPVTVLDGEESRCGPCNAFTPNLRLGTVAATVPEPGTLSLFLVGLGGVAVMIRRSRKTKAE